MLSYALRRLAMIVPVLFGVSVIVFLIMALIPGDPALAILGSFATPENVAGLRRELGLDRSLVEQYGIWLGNLLQGDFGRSYSLNRPVMDEIGDRLGPTLLLAGASLVLCTVLGLAAGVVSAVRQYGWQDKILTLLVLVGLSTPSFWLGLILVLVFSVQLGWFPVSGMYAIYGGGDLADLLHHLALPAITLAVVATGVIASPSRTKVPAPTRRSMSPSAARLSSARRTVTRDTPCSRASAGSLARREPGAISPLAMRSRSCSANRLAFNGSSEGSTWAVLSTRQLTVSSDS